MPRTARPKTAANTATWPTCIGMARRNGMCQCRTCQAEREAVRTRTWHIGPLPAPLPRVPTRYERIAVCGVLAGVLVAVLVGLYT